MIPNYRSTSQRRTLRDCPAKYSYKYEYGYVPRIQKAGTLVGSILHKILERALRPRRGEMNDDLDFTAEALVGAWQEAWDKLKADTLLPAEQQRVKWTKYRKWDVMRARVGALVEVIARELPKRMPCPISEGLGQAEWKLTFRAHAGSDELVILDLYTRVDGKWTVLDFKSSDKVYDDLKAELDEQLTACQMAAESAGGKVEQVGLCVLVWSGEPQIQWLLTPARRAGELMNFVARAKAADDQIKAGSFPKEPESCFTWGRCEYYPLCFPGKAADLPKMLEQKTTMTEEEAALFESEGD